MKNLPCYSNPDVQEDFTKRIREVCEEEEISDQDLEIVKILAPLTDNPNAPNKWGYTIHNAAHNGQTEIVKILAPLTDNPNAPNKWGYTPIHKAAQFGHTEIVKILAPLTDNANGPNWNGNTPIYWAARFGHTEIVKILVSLTDNPNAPNKSGVTPYEYAKTEIREILENFKTSKNHNQCRNTKQSMIV